jgi:di- and tripeptidase
MSTAAPLHNDSIVDTSAGDRPAVSLNRTPSLSHRMKHDKSILTLAVSSKYILAGTQGGEILVCVCADM